jgi:CRISPR-associated protein Cas1
LLATDRKHILSSQGQNRGSGHKKFGQVLREDIAAGIANALGLSYTSNLLIALAQRSFFFVLCDTNHNTIATHLSDN